jgi:pimeloyl-ACP methyl ester carboxylesterase
VRPDASTGPPHARRASGRWRILALTTMLSACAAPPLAPDSRTEPRRLVVNGAELTYVEQGAGEMVVLLHGTATDYRVWDPLRSELGPGFRVVAYSRRHHAPNRPPDSGGSYTMRQHAADLAALIGALGQERAHVVASSLAARTAAYAAVRYPEVLASVTLSDGLLAQPSSEEGKRTLAEIGPQFNRLFAAMGAGQGEEAVRAYVDLASPGKGWDGLSATWKGYYLDNARTLILAGADTTARDVDCAVIGTIRVPVLVLAGELTPPSVRVTNEALLQCLPPGAEYALVPGAAHYWYVDNPGEAARRLTDFVRRHRVR